MSVLFWACAVIAFVVAEIMTIQLVSIWFAAGSLVTLLFSYFYELTAIEQLGIFIISSSIFLLISLPLLRNRRNRKNAVATNAELDVGRHATVIEVINSDKGTGRVTLNGVNWSAVPENENDIIPEGTVVIVKKVMGARLIVAPEK
ncbi:NfeD family protein [Ruminococcus flavefaciens]|uniref:NfeD family protein n=1 Tax=Ruminococcus flavefaciens TaxID=1265 RepID=UPI0026EBBBF1|nr:NfeD family protein [Ruminococcus flavefaciens]MDD7517211.1 NfeD family protein [Ruminococcus flavefaciens]MDY5690127.1 NfeD family protein [Ruminococcus flavefaciens]